MITQYLPTLNKQEGYKEKLTELKNILQQISFDKIHWYKGKALYKIRIDDGYRVSGYSLSIAKDTITLETGSYSHSENFDEFDDGYSDYHSEGEFTSWWLFKMTDNGIVFLKNEIAG